MKPGQLVNLKWLNSKDSNIGLITKASPKELVIIFLDPDDKDGYVYEPSLNSDERWRNIWYEVNESQDPIRITPCTNARPFTNTQYLKWVTLIITQELPVPIQIAQRFFTRCQKAWIRVSNAGYINKANDYHCWGWALFNDITIDAELVAKPFWDAVDKFHLK